MQIGVTQSAVFALPVNGWENMRVMLGECDEVEYVFLRHFKLLESK